MWLIQNMQLLTAHPTKKNPRYTEKKPKNLFNRFLLEPFFFATEFFILLHLSDNHICPPFDNRTASQLRISSAILVLSSSLYNLLSAFTYEEREKNVFVKREWHRHSDFHGVINAYFPSLGMERDFIPKENALIQIQKLNFNARQNDFSQEIYKTCTEFKRLP